MYLFPEFSPVVVCGPDAHVDPVSKVLFLVYVQSLVELLQLGVVQQLLGVSNVLPDRGQFLVGAFAGRGVHPGDLEKDVINLIINARNYLSLFSCNSNFIGNGHTIK